MAISLNRAKELVESGQSLHPHVILYLEGRRRRERRKSSDGEKEVQKHRKNVAVISQLLKQVNQRDSNGHISC